METLTELKEKLTPSLERMKEQEKEIERLREVLSNIKTQCERAAASGESIHANNYEVGKRFIALIILDEIETLNP